MGICARREELVPLLCPPGASPALPRRAGLPALGKGELLLFPLLPLRNDEKGRTF